MKLPCVTREITKLLGFLEQKGRLSEDITKVVAQADLNDPQQVAQLAQFLNAKGASIGRRVKEGVMGAIFSNPKTWGVKALSDTLMGVLEPLKTGVAPAVDVLTGGGMMRPRQRFFGELPALLSGMASGVRDGAVAFTRRLATELPPEVTTPGAFPGPAAEAGAMMKTSAAIPGVTGRIFRGGINVLKAITDFAEVVQARGALHAQAVRQALREGLTGEEAAARATELVLKPSTGLIEAARASGLENTFQKPFGPLGKALMGARRAASLEPAFPAVKIPVNIAKQALSYNPLGFIRIPVGLFGGELKLSGGQMIDQAAKAIVGTGLAAAAYQLAASDRLTGEGPADPGRRKVWLQTHEPNSIRVGDHWLNFDRAEPVGASLSLIADAIHIANEADSDQVWKDASHAFGRAILSKTFAETAHSLLDAAYGLDSSPWRAPAQIAATATIPGVIAQAARTFDPMRRAAAQSVGDVFASRIPGLREQLPPARDYRGEPVPAQGTGPINRMLPVMSTPARGNAVDRMLSDVEATMGPIARSVTIRGHQVNLTPQEYDRLQEISGKRVAMVLDRVGPALVGKPDEVILNQIQNRARQARSIGMEQFIAQLRRQPDFAQRFAESKLRHGTRPLASDIEAGVR